ncbi:17-beta-hydroxysteroid dehydrogenase 13-like [Teleopsis dalmanni]|uniref:17-beta-hydroxysteroid dehydrogenase 13-like n=1 Tax=Teleopsis dalmanni TaxID=139649 RepID=UPI0018CDB208|nr:17-beta-hydroxysteroid dehydrogenase 13-like [Teleopsis dalmanni]
MNFLLDQLGTILINLFIIIAILLDVLFKIYQKLFGSVKSISGEIAVVTGGAGGLGRAISVELAKQGCHIVIVDVNFELAEQTAKSIHEKYKVKTKAYKVDVTNYEEVVELNKNISNEIGKATILVNNAGILTLSDLVNPDPIEVQRMINVNLTSHLWTNRVFLQNMKELNKGHVVAISSVAGLMPLVFSAEYTSTKYGVRGLMEVLRLELKIIKGCQNIRTTTVFPVFLDTNAAILKKIQNINMSNIFLSIQSGEKVAKRIIQGLLRNEENITIPDLVSAYTKYIEISPNKVNSWFASIMYSKHEIKLLKEQEVQKLQRPENIT